METPQLASWQTIVITMPGEVEQEASHITTLLESGAAQRVHLRKPRWSAQQTARLIADIPEHLHPMLQLHDHHSLTRLFPGLKGVHLNQRNPRYTGEALLSTGFHSTAELSEADKYNYATLSPIFDSISKPGYTSRFELSTLPPLLRGKNIIALGGIRPQDFRQLRRIGFRGAALLGYVWQDFNHASRELLKQTALNRHFPLQFITNGNDVESTLRQIGDAPRGGCRWIQIRMKDASPHDIGLAIAAAKPMCRTHRATLLVDDHVELAHQFGIGVHLGKNDMPAGEARNILGPDAIIGSTCNSAEDLRHIFADGCSDYVGLGPFRFTQTKKNLAPVLGLEGYRTLLHNYSPDNLPVVAIGGITAPDIADILRAGADGVAVSGVITHASDPVGSTRLLIKEINKTMI